jgi:HNH endonuclease
MTSNQRKHYNTGQWKKVRISVLARDGYICAYCGQEANTVDHVLALSKGGQAYDMDNLVACCSRCNSMKRDKGAFFLQQSSTPPVLSTNLSPLTHSSAPISPIATIND